MKKKYTDGFFNVGPVNGFLPLNNPLITLPEKYKNLQYILDNMPVELDNGSDGFLAVPNKIEKEVGELENYKEIVKRENDVFVIQALFRGYCFLASAYTLESSYQEFVKTKKYGKARNILPSQISQPLSIVAKKLDVYPWLDYHLSLIHI